MVNPSAYTFFVLVVVFLLALLIEALLLQAACALFNLLTGASGQPPAPTIRRPSSSEPGLARASDTESITTSPSLPPPGLGQAVLAEDVDRVEEESLVLYPGVPWPGLDRAMRIVFVVVLVNVSATFIILRLLRLLVQAAGIVEPAPLPIDLTASLLYFLVLAVMNRVMLPTTFGKGLLVAVIFLFLSFLLGLALFVCLVIAHAFGLSLPRLP